MTLKKPFKTSYGEILDREIIVVEIMDKNGLIGWGECVAFSTPWYTEETVKTCWHMLEDFLIPILYKESINHPDQLSTAFSKVRRNPMAKAAIESAVWDLYAKRLSAPLATVIGGEKTHIKAGVAVGMDSIPNMLNQIQSYLAMGYERIKVKIGPENDRKILSEIRNEFPTLDLMADANSAYTFHDFPHLQSLDEFQLMMIEQPLGSNDIVDHARLQAKMKTPICLDESICSYEDAKDAIALNSCQIINIKIGRVGGISLAKKIHDLCQENGIAVWCGGMLESGIGRAHNIALASLENFTIPGDISASSRYWEEDIVQPEVIVENGLIQISNKPGIGYDINRNLLKKITLASKAIHNS